jgi:hypothetical protein
MLSAGERARAVQALAGFVQSDKAVEAVEALARQQPNRQAFARALNQLIERLQSRKTVRQLAREAGAQHDYDEVVRLRRRVFDPQWEAVLDHPDRHHPGFTVQGLREMARHVRASGYDRLVHALTTASDSDLVRVGRTVERVQQHLRPTRLR